MGSITRQKKRTSRVLEDLARGDVLEYPVKRLATSPRGFDRVAYSARKPVDSSVNKAMFQDPLGSENGPVYLRMMLEWLSVYEKAAAPLDTRRSQRTTRLTSRLLTSAAASPCPTETSPTTMQRYRVGAMERTSVCSKAYLRFCLYSLLTHMQHEAVQLALLEMLQLVRTKALPPSDWVPILPDLLRVLAMHAENASIQQAGLPILAFLCENELCRRRMTGGVELLLRVMKRHASDGLIVCNAAAALCWLIHTGPTAGRARVEKEMKLVLICLLHHFENASVFGNLACVLCGVAVPPEHEQTVVHIVRQGMRFHQSCEKVQESCLRCLRHRQLSNCHTEMLDTIPSILSAMRIHKEKHLQSQAFDVLSILVEGSAALKDSLTDQGVADVVLGLVTDPTTDLAIKQRALLFLSLLLPPHDHAHPFGGSVATIEALWVEYASHASIV